MPVMLAAMSRMVRDPAGDAANPSVAIDEPAWRIAAVKVKWVNPKSSRLNPIQNDAIQVNSNVISDSGAAHARMLSRRS